MSSILDQISNRFYLGMRQRNRAQSHQLLRKFRENHNDFVMDLRQAPARSVVTNEVIFASVSAKVVFEHESAVHNLPVARKVKIEEVKSPLFDYEEM